MCVCGSQQEVRLLGRSEWLLFMRDLQWLSHTRVKIVWQPPYDYRENGQLSDDCIDFLSFFFLHSVGKCKKLQWPTGTRKNNGNCTGRLVGFQNILHKLFNNYSQFHA